MGRSRHSSAATAEFGRRVRAQREGLRLSQIELAERAGLHFTYISDVERGQRNPSLLTALRLAAALGIDLAVLVSELTLDEGPAHSA